MKIHNKLRTSVPFSSLKQGDLFWVQDPGGGLFIKLGGDFRPNATRYPFNSYRVGEEKGGRNIYDGDMVTPVNEITIS